MEYRNPQYTEDGRIDCEVNHPEFGWIPFTADPNDSEKFGRDLFAEIESDGGVAAYVPPEPGPGPVPGEITKVQFVRAMRQQEIWETYRGTIEAHEDWPYITAIPRNDSMTLQMAQVIGATEQEMDDLWTLGATL